MIGIEGFPGIIAGTEKTIQRRLEKANTEDKFDCEELEKVIPISTLTCCMVEAVLELLKNLLPDGYISIGSSFHSHYIHPTVAGMVATITAKLTSVEGKKLHFEIYVYDEIGMICKANHTRYIVLQHGFEKEVAKRIEQLERVI